MIVDENIDDLYEALKLARIWKHWRRVWYVFWIDSDGIYYGPYRKLEEALDFICLLFNWRLDIVFDEKPPYNYIVEENKIQRMAMKTNGNL